MWIQRHISGGSALREQSQDEGKWSACLKNERARDRSKNVLICNDDAHDRQYLDRRSDALMCEEYLKSNHFEVYLRTEGWAIMVNSFLIPRKTLSLISAGCPAGKKELERRFFANTKAFSLLFIHLYVWMDGGFSFSSSSNHARIDTLFWCFFTSSRSRSMLARQPVIRNTHWERIWTGKKMYIDVMMVRTKPEGIYAYTQCKIYVWHLSSLCLPCIHTHTHTQRRHWRDKDNTWWPIRPSHYASRWRYTYRTFPSSKRDAWPNRSRVAMPKFDSIRIVILNWCHMLIYFCFRSISSIFKVKIWFQVSAMVRARHFSHASLGISE